MEEMSLEYERLKGLIKRVSEGIYNPELIIVDKKELYSTLDSLKTICAVSPRIKCFEIRRQDWNPHYGQEPKYEDIKTPCILKLDIMSEYLNRIYRLEINNSDRLKEGSCPWSIREELRSGFSEHQKFFYGIKVLVIEPQITNSLISSMHKGEDPDVYKYKESLK